MRKLKFGIIGCGGIAGAKHLPGLTQQDNVEITAYCDIIPERAAQLNKKFSDGKAKEFADYKELLKEDLDAVCICTPNNMHCQMTVDALMSGKHVMCEKPMAISYEESKKMLEAKEKSGKLLTIGYQNRFRKDSLYLKKECEKGVLGEIYYAKAIALRRRAVPTWGVFVDEEKQGGGPLIDIGTHALDLTLFMMNNYEPLYAVGTTYHKLNNDDKDTANIWGDWDSKKFTAEDSAFGFVVMKNGATVTVEASWALNTLNVREAVCELCGTKAGADMNGEELRINGVNNGSMYVTIPDFKTGGVAYNEGKAMSIEGLECKTFVDAILGKGKLYVLPEQAAVVTRILEGIYISAKTKKPYYFD